MPTDPQNQYAADITALIKQAAQEMGVELRDDLVGFQQSMSESIVRLSRAAGQPGFEEARIAERDSLALDGANIAVAEADAADQRILSIIDTGLAIGARALSLALGVPPAAPA